MSESARRNLPSKSLVLIMGVAGVGKTTLSKGILGKLSLTYLDNNFIADPFFSETRSSQDYIAIRKHFYDVLYRITSENLLVGNSVLLDVPHVTHVQDPAWCLRIRQMAHDTKANLIVIRCFCSEATLRRRLVERGEVRDQDKLANWGDFTRSQPIRVAIPFDHLDVDTESDSAPEPGAKAVRYILAKAMTGSERSAIPPGGLENDLRPNAPSQGVVVSEIVKSADDEPDKPRLSHSTKPAADKIERGAPPKLVISGAVGDDEDKPANPGRRRLIGLGALAVVGQGVALTAAGIDIFEHKGLISRWLQEGYLAFEQKIGINSEHYKLIQHLFQLHEHSGIAFSAGKSHPAPGPHPKLIEGLGYPHEYNALAPYRAFMGKASIVASFFRGELSAGGCLLTAGSPVSNADAREYLPYIAENPKDKVAREAASNLIVKAEDLPYQFFGGAEDMVRVYSAMRQEEKRARLNRVRYRNSETSSPGWATWMPSDPTDNAGWLKEDFLLLSKLPRYSADGTLAGSIIVVAGGHGAGTEAFGLLLNPHIFSAKDLVRLTDELSGASYFQVVFQVEVAHDHIDRRTTPTQLAVVWDPQLRPLRFTPNTDFYRGRKHPQLPHGHD